MTTRWYEVGAARQWALVALARLHGCDVELRHGLIVNRSICLYVHGEAENVDRFERAWREQYPPQHAPGGRHWRNEERRRRKFGALYLGPDRP